MSELQAELASGSAVDRMVRGMRYLPHAGRLLVSHPALWPWVAIPVLLTSVLLVSAAWLSYSWVPALLALVWPVPGGGLFWVFLWHVVAAMLALSVFTVSTVALYFASGLIAVPFNDKLSERVECVVNGASAEPFSLRRVLGDLTLSIAHTLLALVLWLAVMMLLFVLNLMPVVGSALNMVLGAAATGFFVAREMMDGTMSRRRMGFVAKLRLVAAHFPLTVGFGVCVGWMLWIPLLNFVVLPVSVVAGTLLFLDLERQGLVPTE